MDAGLLDALYKAHNRKVFRRAVKLMRNRDAAEDVVQEVFLRAFGARTPLATPEAQLAWLYRITTNVCLNRLRDVGRRGQILLRITPPDEATCRPMMDEALRVRAVMRGVPADLQEIAVRYFVFEMSQDELSAVFEMPRRTVGYRLEQFRGLVLAATHEPAVAS